MWKDINGWEDLYEVNHQGMVRNKITQYIIEGDINSSGYYRVCLYNKNHSPNKKRYFRHRLVAEHFIPNPYNLPEVNHKDNDKQNNSIDNLEWCTRLENERHSIEYGNKQYKNKPFKVIFTNMNEKIYCSTTSLAKELNVTKSCVKHWLHNKTRGYKNYNIKSIEYLCE